MKNLLPSASPTLITVLKCKIALCALRFMHKRGPYSIDVYTRRWEGVLQMQLYSKGGYVNLVLKIWPKCRQGEEEDAENFVRDVISKAPKRERLVSFAVS